MAENIKLIVGLGNVGDKYAHTRHNIGYDLLEKIASKYKISLNPETKFFGLTGRGNIEGHDVRLLFPTTFMNESGKAVAALCNFYKINVDEILVLHDELDLNVGQLKLKFGGGLAGHNGLRSITSCMSGNQNFYRLRIGIGKPANKDVISFVLNKPPKEEFNALEDTLILGGLSGIEHIFKQGISKATTFINGFKLD